jgi:intracellular multiplication protein IcmB
LSTTPGDTNLRNRLYARVGFSEGLRRLSKVFPAGSAIDEIERRTKARLRKGDLQEKAESGVVEELANELIDGHGLGLVLRRFDERETRPAPRPIFQWGQSSRFGMDAPFAKHADSLWRRTEVQHGAPE